MTVPIHYKAGYKYKLSSDVCLQIPIYPAKHIETDYILLDTTGKLTIKYGYCWDGPSGPTVDTKTFMRGSLVHDALYQLIRQGYLADSYQVAADKLLQQMCQADGMNKFRAWWVYTALHFFGKYSIQKNPKIIQTAPAGRTNSL